MTIEPPKSLNRAERTAFTELARQLAGMGIDAGPLLPLLGDYVMLGSRIEALRTQETRGRGKAQAQFTRALTIAMAERRRLHSRIFGSSAPRPATSADPAAAA